MPRTRPLQLFLLALSAALVWLPATPAAAQKRGGTLVTLVQPETGSDGVMTHDLRFQVITLPNAPWDEVLSRFKDIEDLGFDLVTTGDHFVDWTNPSVPWLEAWTVLAAVARETTRIRLATYVSQIPLRNPAMLARQALTVASRRAPARQNATERGPHEEATS